MAAIHQARRLAVDPLACEGIGLCALLAPRAVDLDRWGYPVLARGELDDVQSRQAARAVRACPRRALELRTAQPGR